MTLRIAGWSHRHQGVAGQKAGRLRQSPQPAPDFVTEDVLAGLQGLRVLLAEDHPVNQKVVQLILDPLGVQLEIVSNGDEAVRAYASGIYDLILMDMQMPVMDGLAAVREIRRLEAASGAERTPIAMLTANAGAEHRVLAEMAGADRHVAKPITPESLIAGIMTATFAAKPREPADQQRVLEREAPSP